VAASLEALPIALSEESSEDDMLECAVKSRASFSRAQHDKDTARPMDTTTGCHCVHDVRQIARSYLVRFVDSLRF
jgi:hypothetical protein